MKKAFVLMIAMILCCTIAAGLCACGDTESGAPINGNEDGNNHTETGAKITDYTLPINFVITVQVADNAIHNPGAPWYYKTAKIGNDWQIIKYDRDAVDSTKQATYFFKYAVQDSYEQYSYNHTTSQWEQQNNVTFAGMLEVSTNNYLFLYTKPQENYLNITETDIQYDTDPTSYENLIDARKYEYSNVLDYEITVDRAYNDICLSRTERDGGRGLVENRAYEYTKDIDGWDNPYMSYRQYKPMP